MTENIEVTTWTQFLALPYSDQSALREADPAGVEALRGEFFGAVEAKRPVRPITKEPQVKDWADFLRQSYETQEDMRRDRPADVERWRSEFMSKLNRRKR